MHPDLFAAKPAAGTDIRVGIGGWTFAPWRETFYPAKLAHTRELSYAASQLRTIEVNGTFYGAQKPATYARWAAETPAGFQFSLKAPRYCTEARELAGVGKTVHGFVFGGLSELGDRLGPILWQFRPQRRFDRDDVAAFLDLLPRDLDGAPLQHVLEVRHPSFACADYLALMRTHGLPSVFTDSPDYPSFADLTGDFVYARLMRSREDEPAGYPAAELDAWADRARAWAAGRAPADLPYVEAADAAPIRSRAVHVYFISAAKVRNPAAAIALQTRLAR